MFLLIAMFLVGSAMSQVHVSLETTLKADTTHTLVPVNRIVVNTKVVTLKYDYKANGADVMGVFIPKIIGDSTGELGAAVIKIGDMNGNERVALDVWGKKRFGEVSLGLEIGRMISQQYVPWDYAIVSAGYWHFTGEIGMLLHHPLYKPTNSEDARYWWLAFHPKHVYVSAGRAIDTYWGFAGTKDLNRFGTFNFFSYDVKKGDFWFKSQTGFGKINQKFFHEDLYNEATQYFCVPPFFYKHFSPLSTKGTYAVKLEGRRTGRIYNYEAMLGHIIGDDVIQIAIGANSEVKDGKIKVAPSLELYKSFKVKDFTASLEIRYDALYKALSGYAIIRY